MSPKPLSAEGWVVNGWNSKSNRVIPLIPVNSVKLILSVSLSVYWSYVWLPYMSACIQGKLTKAWICNVPAKYHKFFIWTKALQDFALQDMLPRISRENQRKGGCRKSYLICKMYPNWLYRWQESDKTPLCIFYEGWQAQTAARCFSLHRVLCRISQNRENLGMTAVR